MATVGFLLFFLFLYKNQGVYLLLPASSLLLPKFNLDLELWDGHRMKLMKMVRGISMTV